MSLLLAAEQWSCGIVKGYEKRLRGVATSCRERISTDYVRLVLPYSP